MPAYKCPHCDHKFTVSDRDVSDIGPPGVPRTRTTRKIHMSVSGDTPVECPECGKSFYRWEMKT